MLQCLLRWDLGIYPEWQFSEQKLRPTSPFRFWLLLCMQGQDHEALLLRGESTVHSSQLHLPSTGLGFCVWHVGDGFQDRFSRKITSCPVLMPMVPHWSALPLCPNGSWAHTGFLYCSSLFYPVDFLFHPNANTMLCYYCSFTMSDIWGGGLPSCFLLQQYLGCPQP